MGLLLIKPAEVLLFYTGAHNLAVDGDWIPVRTDQNTLLYYLLFASKHRRGNEFWRKIKRIDPHGQRHLFS
jgi:hypothetical protein